MLSPKEIASIAAKALIWVDAADPVASHIAETDAGVSVWYDRREGADVSSPSYCRASAYTGYTATLPAKSTVDGNLPAIYFGGVGSGCCMEFTLPSGSRLLWFPGLTGGFPAGSDPAQKPG